MVNKLTEEKIKPTPGQVEELRATIVAANDGVRRRALEIIEKSKHPETGFVALRVAAALYKKNDADLADLNRVETQ